jgi:hypothetical protein
MIVKGKFKQLIPYQEQIIEDYIQHDMNISEISEKYKVHYSNLRRFINEVIQERKLDHMFNVQYLNVEDFPWLEIGDTFQFGEELTVFRVNKFTEKENQQVLEMVPVKNKNKIRHWIPGDNCFNETSIN